ncbi:MAG: hypothetical protein WAL22_20930 [Solirubrobacteraceae bacterium]
MLGFGWRPIFLINVPITLAVMLAGARWLPHSRPAGRSQRLDPPDAATLPSTVLAIILPLTLGRDNGWPVWTWFSLASSVPLLALFVAIEQRQMSRGRAPLVDRHVIARPPSAGDCGRKRLASRRSTRCCSRSPSICNAGPQRARLRAPWVMAFAVPGRVLGRMPARTPPLLPTIGCLILAVAYAAISVSMLAALRSAKSPFVDGPISLRPPAPTKLIARSVNRDAHPSSGTATAFPVGRTAPHEPPVFSPAPTAPAGLLLLCAGLTKEKPRWLALSATIWKCERVQPGFRISAHDSLVRDPLAPAVGAGRACGDFSQSTPRV